MKSLITTTSLIKIIFAVTIIFSSTVHSQTLKAPVGVRPCCAFGIDLKAELGGMPVPFFSLENTLSSQDIGSHAYNDGSQRVSLSLLNLNKEVNGIIYTARGGFIDTAHVRDTADFTYYLFKLTQQNLGLSAYIDLPEELRIRRIRWYQQDEVLTEKQRLEYSVEAAALTAFRLAQWHEIAQWFGMASVGGFGELASAFSPEDLYSNMLGASIAKAVILAQPTLSQDNFAVAMDNAFQQRLIELGAQNKTISREKIRQLDGHWWDSSRRLPDKWVVRFRAYNMATQLKPTADSATHPLQLDEQFSNGQSINKWMSLELLQSDEENAFSDLPTSLRQHAVWRAEDFQPMADFAQWVDDQTRPQHL